MSAALALMLLPLLWSRVAAQCEVIFTMNPQQVWAGSGPDSDHLAAAVAAAAAAQLARLFAWLLRRTAPHRTAPRPRRRFPFRLTVIVSSCPATEVVQLWPHAEQLHH